jgi:hypothetical protein
MQLQGRVSDPDTDWIRIQSGQRIRIRNPEHIRNPAPDPGGQKLPTKKQNSLEILCFEVLDVFFWWLKASSVAWTSL